MRGISLLVLGPVWLVVAGGCSGSGNVEVDVALDPGLVGQLEVVSVRGDRPGEEPVGA